MKSTVNLDKNKTIKEKNNKKIASKGESKYNYDDDLSLLIEKKKKRQAKNKDSVFRNNYKNYQYDYEEDFYEPL